MAFGERPLPGTYRLRTQLDEPDVAEDIGRFRQQPTQLFDRRRCRLMHFQILSDQLGERQRRGAATGRESRRALA